MGDPPMGITCGREPAVMLPPTIPSVPVPVTLHVYDISCLNTGRTLNCVLGTLMGAGAFHCGVEVHCAEWSYGEVEGSKEDSFPPVTGVFTSKPRECSGHTYSRSVEMGTTNASLAELRKLIKLLEQDWPAHLYDLVTRNCCHFCNELCQRLQVGGIPDWVNKLASAGSSVEHGMFEVSDMLCCETMGEVTYSLCQNQGARSCRRKDEEEDSPAEETEIHYLL